MTKTKKRPQLKPLIHGEIIKFLCGTNVEIRRPEGDAIIFKSNIFASLDDRIVVEKRNIPLIIKTLRRAQITK